MLILFIVQKLDITELYEQKDTFDGSTFFKRTMPLDLLGIPYRQAVKDFRETYYSNKNTKNPTDIIIFTDAYSYSQQVHLLKAYKLQEVQLL